MKLLREQLAICAQLFMQELHDNVYIIQLKSKEMKVDTLV